MREFEGNTSTEIVEQQFSLVISGIPVFLPLKYSIGHLGIVKEYLCDLAYEIGETNNQLASSRSMI